MDIIEEDDEWNLSTEELDSLERHALAQIAERSSSAASHSPEGGAASASAAKLDWDHRQNGPSLLACRVVPPFTGPSITGKDSKQQQPRRLVKFFLHASGQIASKFSYDPLLVGAFHNIPKASWNTKERLWMFPISSLLLAEKVLNDLSGSSVEVENLDPLVKRAIAAASNVPDLQGRYDLIPRNIESKLLPFQRDAVRFVLQHGGRALLADEMGLGKTLQVLQGLVVSVNHELLGCIRIDGGTPAASRQALVMDFQEKSCIKAAVLSIKAGGIGLTLTAASTVIFAELSWTPGDLIQAEDRVHRIGQVSSVNVCYLLANDTIDDIIWDVVQSKLENLGQMLDGREHSMEVSVSQQYNSPGKQRTLDSSMKRCSNSSHHEQILKRPKY